MEKIKYSTPDNAWLDDVKPICVASACKGDNDAIQSRIGPSRSAASYMARAISEESLRDRHAQLRALPESYQYRTNLVEPTINLLCTLALTKSRALRVKKVTHLLTGVTTACEDTVMDIRTEALGLGLIKESGAGASKKVHITPKGESVVQDYANLLCIEIYWRRQQAQDRQPFEIEAKALERANKKFSRYIRPHALLTEIETDLQKWGWVGFNHLTMKNFRQRYFLTTAKKFKAEPHKRITKFKSRDRIIYSIVILYSKCDLPDSCPTRVELHGLVKKYFPQGPKMFDDDRQCLHDLGLIMYVENGRKKMHCPTDVGLWTCSREYVISQICDDWMLANMPTQPAPVIH